MNKHDFVPETRFGIWFLGSQTWVKFVLEVEVADLAETLLNLVAVNPEPA